MASQIPNPLTKEHFNEVVRCYNSDCYRTSVIMLWSTVICDLFFKLQELAEHYKDNKAEKILEEVAKSHEGGKYPPAWEIKFLESVKEKTEILDDNQYNKLLYLQKTRHLAVHPKIKQHSDLFSSNKLELFNPDKNETHSLICEILKGLLIKKPLHSKKIFDRLVEDLEEHSNIPVDNKLLESHLHEAYYDQFTTKVKKFVFKGLWHNLFEVKNERCENIRGITYRAFLLLFDTDPSTFIGQIMENETYFSRIAKKGSPVIYLIRFLARQPSIHKLLNSRAKLAIDSTIRTDSLARCFAHFISQNMHEHAKNLDKWIREESPNIENDVWNELPSISNSPEWTKEVIRLANTYYGTSVDNSTADKRFEAVKELLEKYDESDLVDLMQKVEESSLTRNRKRTRTDHQQIVSRMKDVNSSFNFKQFKTFAKYQ